MGKNSNKATTKSTIHPDKMIERELKYDEAPTRDDKWIKQQIKYFPWMRRLFQSWKPPRLDWKKGFNPDLSFEYQVYVGCLLSAQSKDEQVMKALINLEMMGVLSVEEMAKAKADVVASSLGLSICNKKAGYLIEGSQMMLEKHDGKVPASYLELKKLPGVGEKIAGCIMSEAFGVNDYVKEVDSSSSEVS